jgi:mannosylfructose-phosphate synthase
MHDKKRIMMISTHGYVAADPPLGAPDTGGQVVYILELAKKLGQFGYDVDIWTRRFEDQPDTDIVDEHVRVLRVPCGGKAFIPKEYLVRSIPEWVENARKRIKKEKLTYSFINSHYWDAGVAGQHLAHQLSIPHVHTPHSIGTWKQKQMLTDFPDSEEEFEERYNFTERIRTEGQLYRSCDLITATTPIQVDLIQEAYDIDQEKIRMIPPGYDDNRFFPVGPSTKAARKERLGFGPATIFAVSRLAHNKGFDLLIDAFSVAVQRIPEAELVLAIGYEDRNETEQAIYETLLERVSQYGLGKKVRFTGFIADEDLPDYYRAADLFVLSSRYEPFGMTSIEAMASGTPVVVTAHGGLARVLSFGDNALIADPFDSEEFGIAIYQALHYRRLRRRLSSRGAALARSRFTWTGIAQQLLDAVDTCTDAFEEDE